MISSSNLPRFFVSSIDAMPPMLRSGAFRSCETARRNSSFSAISLLNRLFAAASCAVRCSTLFSRSRLACARSSCCFLTRMTISLKDRASTPITSGRWIATRVSRSPPMIRCVASTSRRMGWNARPTKRKAKGTLTITRTAPIATTT